MRAALRDVVESAIKHTELRKDDIVVDIGSNDGTLLSYYPLDVVRVGFEPSENVGKSALGGSVIIYDFFTSKGHESITPMTKKKAKIITCISVFYDIQNPNKFLRDVKKILALDGLFIIQMNYLPTMLQTNGFDNVEHEHITYWSLETLWNILLQNGLGIQEVEYNDVNGGSFRVYVRHFDKEVNLGLGTSLPGWFKEQEMELKTFKPYHAFSRRIGKIAFKLKAELLEAKIQQGKRIYALGAGTRGLTILQFADIDNRLIDLAVEKNPEKVGKTYGSTKIPIISEEQARSSPPDYYFITAPHYLAHFVKQEWDFLQKGGKFIIPLPQPTVLGVESL